MRTASRINARDQHLVNRAGIGAGRVPQWRKELYRRYVERKCNPNLGGVVEAISYSFYDQVTVAANTAFPQTLLFQTQLGVGGKLLSATNMTFGGVLPNPQRFTIWAIAALVSNLTIPADMANIVQNVTLQLQINTKPYQVGPLAQFPAGRGFQVSAVSNVGTAPSGSAPIYTTSNGPISPAGVFMFDIPITVEQGEQFQVLLVPQTAFNTSATTTNPPGVGTTITVFLDGNWERGVS